MRWNSPRLSDQFGLLFMAVGIIVIVLGWNGAAGESEVDAQMPYLLSGGAAGLAFVVLGAALLIVRNARRDRMILEARFQDLSQSVTRLAYAVADTMGAGVPDAVFVAGSDSYHRPDCRLVEGKALPRVTATAIAAEHLEPCRVCNPSAPPGHASLTPR
jgi:hypothetical protein